MENSSVASASSEAGSTRSQEIEELERFIDSYVLEYQVQGLLEDKADEDLLLDNGGKVPQVRASLSACMTCFISLISAQQQIQNQYIKRWTLVCLFCIFPNKVQLSFMQLTLLL